MERGCRRGTFVDGVNKMEIRRMTENDLAEVGALYAASWKQGYKRLLPQEYLDGITADWYKARTDFLDEGSFVILDGERIAAHCHARPAAEPQMRGWGEIHTMYALPQFWGKGHAGELLDYAANWLCECGFDDVYLYVLEGNERAERFYTKHGFRANGDTIQCEVGGKTVTDKRMVKSFPRSTRYGEIEIQTVESGADAVECVLKTGDFNARNSLLLCLDWYLDPYYRKTLPEREQVVEVLREYEKTAADSTLFAVQELLEFYC